jgi:hypothetical protein
MQLKHFFPSYPVAQLPTKSVSFLDPKQAALKGHLYTIVALS